MPDSALQSVPSAVRSRAALIATAAVFVVLAVRQHTFVRQYAVDVLYWDAWDLYDPLFRGQGWWASFDLQHGPHRQGLGGLVMRVTAGLTRWDTRADAAAVSWTLIAAVPLGVWLAWRCGVRGWPLVGVPVIYLNARQYDFFIAPANPAYGAIPLLLFTVLGLAWFARRTAVRLSLVVGLTAGLIFTGFGLFVGVVTPVVLIAEAVTAHRGGDRRRAVAAAIAVAGVGAAWAAFAHGWVPDVAAGDTRFPFERPVEYLYFVGTMLANQVGVAAPLGEPGWGTIALGLTVWAVHAWVAVDRGRRAVRAGVTGDRASVVVFCLAAFGLVYTANATLGRTPFGWQTGALSRYVTLGIPAAFAVLLHLALSSRPATRWAAIAYAGLLAAGTVALHAADRRAAISLHNGCVRWATAYRSTHDQAAADRIARFPIFPTNDLHDRLAFLERNRLNLFASTPPRTAGR